MTERKIAFRGQGPSQLRIGPAVFNESTTQGMHVMDARLLDILVCPLCKGPLLYKKSENELICKADRLAFPIKDGIPVMLEDEARRFPPEIDIT